jgi:hypothetical protein
MLLVLVSLISLITINSLVINNRIFGRALVRSSSSSLISYNILQAKPDLFSDDLFEDDDENDKPVKKQPKEEDKPKRKYLEQKWQLTAEDAKDFKGFPRDGKKEAVAEKAVEKVPCFALMYKFRKEYLETGIEAALADHKGHCAKFKRLMNSEVIHLGKAKGVVLLWAGFTESDKQEVKTDIMSFLEDDPLIAKDIVENWDLIDLAPDSKPSTPAEIPATASK